VTAFCDGVLHLGIWSGSHSELQLRSMLQELVAELGRVAASPEIVSDRSRFETVDLDVEELEELLG
jgi:hypothetical protein